MKGKKFPTAKNIEKDVINWDKKQKTINLETKIEDAKSLHDMGTFIHGGLFFGHAIGVYYNLRRKNYKDALIHTVFCIYDLGASINHGREVFDQKKYGE